MTVIPALPPSITYGKVVGRFLLAVADSSADTDRTPDSKAAQGTITFSPVQTNVLVDSPETALIVKMPIRCALDVNGRLVDPEGQLGVWLITGSYKVTYAITGVAVSGHSILVLDEHTDANPMQLNNAVNNGGTPLIPSEYATLSARIDALAATEIYSKSEVDSLLADLSDLIGEVASRDIYTKVEVDSLLEQLSDAVDAVAAKSVYLKSETYSKSEADSKFSPQIAWKQVVDPATDERPVSPHVLWVGGNVKPLNMTVDDLWVQALA